MKKINESEKEEIEALNHYFKYINLKPNVCSQEITLCMMELNRVAEKYIGTDYDENEFDRIINMQDLKEFTIKIIEILVNHVQFK